jgi:ferredoxin--NADP+ reductase
LPRVSDTRFLFHFLASPHEICSDAQGHVSALEVEENKLVAAGDDTKAVGLGIFTELVCDTVIFAIGDRVEASFGLPEDRGEFVKNPTPEFPVDGVSYEAYDPLTHHPVPGIFLAGWARRASTGLVGVARKDGTNGALAVSEYLKKLPAPRGPDLDALEQLLRAQNVRYVTKHDLQQLEAVEKQQAQARGLVEFKFSTNQEMLDALTQP